MPGQCQGFVKKLTNTEYINFQPHITRWRPPSLSTWEFEGRVVFAPTDRQPYHLHAKENLLYHTRDHASSLGPPSGVCRPISTPTPSIFPNAKAARPKNPSRECVWATAAMLLYRLIALVHPEDATAAAAPHQLVACRCSKAVSNASMKLSTPDPEKTKLASDEATAPARLARSLC